MQRKVCLGSGHKLFTLWLINHNVVYQIGFVLSLIIMNKQLHEMLTILSLSYHPVDRKRSVGVLCRMWWWHVSVAPSSILFGWECWEGNCELGRLSDWDRRFRDVNSKVEISIWTIGSPICINCSSNRDLQRSVGLPITRRGVICIFSAITETVKDEFKTFCGFYLRFRNWFQTPKLLHNT